jgi:glutathione synthase/RimK-type ligase-like ATP-grasp enzyme
MTSIAERSPTAEATAPSTLRSMYWVFPDRESARARPMYEASFWRAYEEVAEELGMRWVSVPPDAIAVDGLDPHAPRVYVNGEEATPADSLFVTALYSLPYQAMDVFNQYAVYAVLEQCGFYLPAPPRLAAVFNDKLTTLLYLKDSPIAPIPTVRLGTGRDLKHKLYEPALANLTFPLIVKPTGWCAGWGICMARNVEDLRGMLSLAQGGDTTLVCQPYLGDGTVDYRLNVAGGVVRTVLRRSPMAGSYVANTGRGGRGEWADLPPELAAAVPWFNEKLPLPFYCADFLYDGEKYWFSEVELDGAIMVPDPTDPAAVAAQRATIAARFQAYRDAHAAHTTTLRVGA